MIDLHILEKARTHAIERIATQHNLRLRGKVERIGPCPRCGGTDRFSINVRKQVWNCRGCQKGGDVIAFVQFLDGCNFQQAIASLTGDPIDGDNKPSPQCELKAEQAPSARITKTDSATRRDICGACLSRQVEHRSRRIYAGA